MIKRFFEAKRLRPYKTCALMLDVRGRDIRTSNVKDDKPLEFVLGDTCKIRGDDFSVLSTSNILQINCPELPKMMRPQDLIYFNDGQLSAQVTDVEIDEIKIEFRSSGSIPSYAAIKLTGAKYGQLPLLKKEDYEDIKDFAVKHRFDYICLPCT